MEKENSEFFIILAEKEVIFFTLCFFSLPLYLLTFTLSLLLSLSFSDQMSMYRISPLNPARSAGFPLISPQGSSAKQKVTFISVIGLSV